MEKSLSQYLQLILVIGIDYIFSIQRINFLNCSSYLDSFLQEK
jgi:hypothetical protein